VRNTPGSFGLVIVPCCACELAVDAMPLLKLATAFDELRLAI
jgi:hypothetical protein